MNFDRAYLDNSGKPTIASATTVDMSPISAASTHTLRRRRIEASPDSVLGSSMGSPSDPINPTVLSRFKRKFEIDVGVLSGTVSALDYTQGFGRLEKYLDFGSGLSTEEWRKVLVALAV
jgi:hypothetical protein